MTVVPTNQLQLQGPEQFNFPLSADLLAIREHKRHECFANAALSWERAIWQAMQSGSRQVIDAICAWRYCQGWWLKRHHHNGALTPVIHGWLQTPVGVVDGTALLHANKPGDDYWLAVQSWTLDAFLDERAAFTGWPLSWEEGQPKLDQRPEYIGAILKALKQLGLGDE